MSFNINNTNFQCAPMFNKNKNNQVMGYLCSSQSRNSEGFQNLIDTTSSQNKGKVEGKDAPDNPWHYLGGVQIKFATQNENTSYLQLNFIENNGDSNKAGLKKLIDNLNVSKCTPFIFHLYDQVNSAWVVRAYPFEKNGTARVSVEGQTLFIAASRSTGISDDDFNSLKTVSRTMEARVGVFDTEDGSQVKNIDSIWNA